MRLINSSYFKSGRKLAPKLISRLLVLLLRAPGEFLYSSCAMVLKRRSSIFSCTTNGALLMSTLKDDNSAVSHKLAALPSRLCDWRLSHDSQTFAYGGDEVEISLWDTER